MAGMPKQIIRKSKQILKTIRKKQEVKKKTKVQFLAKIADMQLSFFQAR